LFGTSQRLKSLSGLQSVNVAGAVISLSDKVKILAATLDANLTMVPHIKALSSSYFYHIHSFRKIRSSLDDTMALSVASAVIFFMPGSVELHFVWHFAQAHRSPSMNPACSSSGYLEPAFSHVFTILK